jgi:hypothetical protein
MRRKNIDRTDHLESIAPTFGGASLTLHHSGADMKLTANVVVHGLCGILLFFISANALADPPVLPSPPGGPAMPQPPAGPSAPPTPGPTGIIYQDTKLLYDAIGANPSAPVNPAMISQVLATYGATPKDAAANPFLSPLLIDWTAAKLPRDLTTNQNPGPLPAPETVGLASASTLIDAAAQYLILQAKNDYKIVAILAAQRVAKENHMDKFLGVVFPETYPYLISLTTQQIANNAYVPTLNDDFKDDLTRLPSRLDSIIATLHPPQDITRYTVHILADTGEYVYERQHPIEIVDSLESSAQLMLDTWYPAHGAPVTRDPKVGRADAGLKFAAIASHLLRKSKETWASSSDIRRLAADCPDDIRLIRVMLGLSYLQDAALYRGIELDLSLPSSWWTALGADVQRLSNTKAAIIKVVQDTDALTADNNSLNNQPNAHPVTWDQERPILNDLVSLVQDSNDGLVGLGIPLSKTLPDGSVSDVDAFDASMIGLKQIVNLIGAIRTNDYMSAVRYASQIVPMVAQTTVAGDDADMAKARKDFIALMSNTDWNFVMGMATVASASDFAALEASVNGNNYLSKQTSGYSADLYGYLGIEAGVERINGTTDGVPRDSYRAAVFAPIGVDLSWHIPEHDYIGSVVGSAGLFVPIIDIGTVTAYRFENSSGSLPPITWSNVFAPGAYGVIHFRNIPISFLAGIQYGPGLRKLTASGATVEKATFVVPSVALTFEIPLHPLYRSQ